MARGLGNQSPRNGGRDPRGDAWRDRCHGEFQLGARADRIERISDGRYAVLDYKTGRPPTDSGSPGRSRAATHLEGAILSARRFQGYSGQARRWPNPIYLGLRRRSRGRTERKTVLENSSPTKQADKALARLRDVVEEFALPQTAYQSFTRPQWVGRTYSDYDHLARVKEWSAFGGEDDGDLRCSALRKPPPPPSSKRSRKRPIRPSSAWVSANAGSGKTHVLTERVIRLLLTGNRTGEYPLHHVHQGGGRQYGNARFRAPCRIGFALDDAGLDARIVGARHCRLLPIRCARAPAIRGRDRDAGRPESADHPRLLYAASASVSVRRPALPLVSTCSMRRPEWQLLEKLTLDVMLEGASNPAARWPWRFRPRSPRGRSDIARRHPPCGRKA